jgi:hypothetical protein
VRVYKCKNATKQRLFNYKDMKTYEAKYDPLKNKGVYGISLVENPAMEGLFIALSKDEPLQLKEIDKEQRILMGLVLEPNKPIYRNQNGEEFNIVFNEETIKDLSYGFFKNNNHSNSTIEHDVKQNIQGVTFTESWIVENPKIDKSTNFGFEYPKGSWLAVMKVDDDAIWNDYVKTGKVQGFSIDAMLSLEEVNLTKINLLDSEDAIFFKENELKEGIECWLNDEKIPVGEYILSQGYYTTKLTILEDGIVGKVQKEVNLKSNIEMSNTNNLLEQIWLAVKPVKKIQLGSMMLVDGSLKIEWEGDTLSEGLSVWVTADDGTKVPVPVGEHPLEDGTILVVEVEGIAKEIKPAPAQDMSEPAGQGMTDAAATEIAKAIAKSVLIKYEAQDALISELKAELSELKTQVIELGRQPSEKPIKNTTTVTMSQKGKFSDLLNKLNN